MQSQVWTRAVFPVGLSCSLIFMLSVTYCLFYEYTYIYLYVWIQKYSCISKIDIGEMCGIYFRKAWRLSIGLKTEEKLYMVSSRLVGRSLRLQIPDVSPASVAGIFRCWHEGLTNTLKKRFSGLSQVGAALSILFTLSFHFPVVIAGISKSLETECTTFHKYRNKLSWAVSKVKETWMSVLQDCLFESSLKLFKET
jgi:hypothetical protein